MNCWIQFGTPDRRTDGSASAYRDIIAELEKRLSWKSNSSEGYRHHVKDEIENARQTAHRLCARHACLLAEQGSTNDTTGAEKFSG